MVGGGRERWEGGGKIAGMRGRLGKEKMAGEGEEGLSRRGDPWRR